MNEEEVLEDDDPKFVLVRLRTLWDKKMIGKRVPNTKIKLRVVTEYNALVSLSGTITMIVKNAYYDDDKRRKSGGQQQHIPIQIYNMKEFYLHPTTTRKDSDVVIDWLFPKRRMDDDDEGRRLFYLKSPLLEISAEGWPVLRVDQPYSDLLST